MERDVDDGREKETGLSRSARERFFAISASHHSRSGKTTPPGAETKKEEARGGRRPAGAGGARPREVPRAAGGQGVVGVHIGFILDIILVGGF